MASEAQCDSCGEPNPAGTPFCLFCGAYLGWDQPGAGPAGSGTTQQASPSPAQASPDSHPPTGPPPGPDPSPHPAAERAPTSAPTGPQPEAAGGVRPAVGRDATLAGVAGPRCPSCGHPNGSARRFCERCGFSLTTPAPASAPPTRTGAEGARHWWSRSPEDRSSRRAYRRSLPPLYRWRRVIVALLLVGLAVGVVSVVGATPSTGPSSATTTSSTRRSRSRTSPRPPSPAGPTRRVRRTASRRRSGTRLGDEEPRTSRGARTQRDSLRLTLQRPARVRGLRVSPGLRAQNDDRLLHPQPTSLLVSWSTESDGRRCVSLAIEEGAESRDLAFDTERPVGTLWVAVGAVKEAANTTVERPAVIRDVAVLRRPE